MKTIAVYLTGACNLRCKHCSVGLDQYKPRPALTDDQICTVIDRAAARGVEFITFLGGEPTYTNHDLDRICTHATKRSVKISINTNLVLPEKIYALLRHDSLRNIVVSLDGARPETHDKMRGKGMFARTHANLAELIARRDKVGSCATIDTTFALSELNRADSVRIVQSAAELGVDGLNINIVQPIGRGKQFAHLVAGQDAAYLDAIGQIISFWSLYQPDIKLSIPLPPLVAEYMSDRYGVPGRVFENRELCGGTSVYTYVDLVGNLLPCPGLSFEEGRNPEMNRQHENLSILEHPIDEIEESSVFRAFEKARKLKSKNALFEPCSSCKYRDACSPCTSSFYKAGEERRIFLCGLVSDLETEAKLQLAAE